MPAPNLPSETLVLNPTKDDLNPPWLWLIGVLVIIISALALYTGPWVSPASSRYHWLETPVVWYSLFSLILVYSAYRFWESTHPKAFTLKLDAEGFESARRGARSRYSWRDINGAFTVKKMSYRKLVVFASRQTPFWNALRGPHAIPHLYGYAADDLAKLMNEWKGRAAGPVRPSTA